MEIIDKYENVLDLVLTKEALFLLTRDALFVIEPSTKKVN